MEKNEVDLQRDKQVMLSQSYAIQIESLMYKVLGISKIKVGGLEYGIELGVDAGDIRQHPYYTIQHGLFYYLATHPDKKNEIIKFIQDYSFIEDMRVDDILSFVISEYEFQKITYTLPEDNGVIYLEKMIRDFENIIK